MEGRTVGSSALAARDSDQTHHSPSLATLLRAGVAQGTPLEGRPQGAALAYIPEDGPGLGRGALFALAQRDLPESEGQPGGALALRYLAESFYSSLCRDGGRALESAFGATSEYLRELAWRGKATTDCGVAAVVVRERHLWMAAAGQCVAYVLRIPLGGWQAPGSGVGQRLDVYAQPGTPIVLETGDIVILGSPGLQARLPEALIKNCLLALVTSDPGITEQNLAEVLVRLAESKPGPGTPTALVMRCHGVLPASQAQSQGWPAAYRLASAVPTTFAWDFPMLDLLASSGKRRPVAPPPPAAIGAAVRLQAEPDPVPAPPDRSTRPVPVTASTRDYTTRPIAVAEVGADADTVTNPLPRVDLGPEGGTLTHPIPVFDDADPATGRQTRPIRIGQPAVAVPGRTAASRPLAMPPAVRGWFSAGPATWMAAERRVARVLLPGTSMLAGGGLLSSYLSGNANYLLFGGALGGLLFCSATLPGRGLPGRLSFSLGSASAAKDRLQSVTRGARARPYEPPPRPAAARPRVSTSGALSWGKDRLVLPPSGAMKSGCVDILALKDRTGRMVAQLVLVCPPHLLENSAAQPGGIYVILHDMLTDQKRMVAWLAPAQRRNEAIDADVAAYGSQPGAAVRWLRGQPEFELASSRVRVVLQLNAYSFLDTVRKGHLDTFEATIADVQAIE